MTTDSGPPSATPQPQIDPSPNVDVFALQQQVQNLQRTVDRLLLNGLQPALVNSVAQLPGDYKTAAPTDTPVNGSFRFVVTGGIKYLYARIGGAWVRVIMAP